MDTNSMFSFFDILIIFCGGYVLFAWYQLQYKDQVREGLLVTKGTETKKCRDLPAYKKYMGWRTLLMGCACLLSGIVGLMQDFGMAVPMVLYWSLYIFFFVIVVWYAMCAKKAQKQYFGNI